MKRDGKCYLLAGIAMIAFPSFAQAATADNRDVVRDSRGTIVVSSNGECVRTQWVVGEDQCAPGKPRVAAQRTNIAQEARTVYFEFNKSSLTSDARARLDSLAGTLKAAQDVQGARIVGYADRMGSADYNERLSKKRAESVRRYLVSKGYLNSRVAETRWLGESAPATNCPDTLSRNELIECLQKDRKVEVEIDYRATQANQ